MTPSSPGFLGSQGNSIFIQVLTIRNRLATAYCIYQTTMWFSQNELNRDIKARLPFEFKNEQVKEVYRLLKEHEKEQGQKQKEEARSKSIF